MGVIPVAGRQIELPLPSRARRRLSLRLSVASALVLLATAAAVGLMLLPVAYLLLRSVSSGQAAIEILAKPSTLATLGRTIALTASVTMASAFLAVPIAWLTVCTDLPGRRVWTVLAILPLVLPSFVVAYLVASVLGPRGLVQQVMEPLVGLQRLPDIYGFPGALLVLTMMSYPFTLVTVRAGLRRMDPSLVEAARTLGFSHRAAFWRVTLPQLRPSLVAGSLLVALYVLRDFGAVTMMRYNTFTRIIYIQYQSFMSRSLAAALALALVGLVVIVFFLEQRTRGRAQYSRRSAGTARLQKRVRLGLWRWPALIFMSIVVFVALLVPAAGLAYWLIKGFEFGRPLMPLLRSSSNSFGIALITAGVTVIVAIPVSIFIVRRSGWSSRLVERLMYSGYALPGIVIALALVYFGVTFARSLYQTLFLLVVAYLILFLPLAVGATRASMLRVPLCLEEAGRSLGRRQWHVFRRVTLPLLLPGIYAGGALVFLTAMKELPATLILSPTGFRTLSTSVWANISEAFFAQAAAPALLLILLSSIPLAFLTFREK